MSFKSGFVSFLLWLCALVGLCGLHRFYTGRYVTGFIWLFTLGLLGVGQLIDLFLLPGMIREANLKAALAYGVARGGVESGNTNANTNTVAPVFNVSVNLPPAALAAATQPALQLLNQPQITTDRA